MPRPTILTAEKQDRICKALAVGERIVRAVRHGPIGEATHHEWVRRGRACLAEYGGELDDVPTEEHERQFAEYATATEKALGDHERQMLALIQRSAAGQPYRKERTVTAPDGTTTTTVETGTQFSWQAAAWILERKYPAIYGRYVKTELSGEVGTSPQQAEDTKTVAELFGVDESEARELAKVIHLRAKESGNGQEATG